MQNPLKFQPSLKFKQNESFCKPPLLFEVPRLDEAKSYKVKNETQNRETRV